MNLNDLGATIRFAITDWSRTTRLICVLLAETGQVGLIVLLGVWLRR